MKTVEEVLDSLNKLAHTDHIKSRAKFGINTEMSIGLTVPMMRTIAKEIGPNHALALQLWKTKIHEARHIAVLITRPADVTEKLMDDWSRSFNSWDIVDHCATLFAKTPFAYKRAIEWCKREEEYIRRAGFSMIAILAVHDKKADDKMLEQFFPYIYKYSGDERNFVRKAVNWALRQVGKRNVRLCKKAIKLAKEIRIKDDRSSKWIAADALRELEKYQAEGKIKNVGKSSK